jgi:hypothetical protein
MFQIFLDSKSQLLRFLINPLKSLCEGFMRVDLMLNTKLKFTSCMKLWIGVI